MAKTNHLLRRDAIYWWRARLPKPLCDILGRTHHARSLGTADHATARRLARRLSMVVENLAHRMMGSDLAGERQPSKADLDRVLLDLFNGVLNEGEQERASRPVGTSPWTITDEDIEQASIDLQGVLDPHTGEPYDPEQFLMEQMEPDIGASLRDRLQLNDTRPILPSIERLFAKHGLAMPTDSQEWPLFLRKAAITVLSALDTESEREQGIYKTPVHPYAFGASATADTEAKAVLSEAVDDYAYFQREEGNWKPGTDTESQARLAVRLFIACKGDLPYNQITKADAMHFRTWLCGLPSLIGRSIYTGKTPVEATALRSSIETALRDQPRAKTLEVAGKVVDRAKAGELGLRMSKTTVNRHIIFMLGLTKVKCDRDEVVMANPFNGVSFKEKARKKGESKRKPWPISDLQTLFSAPVWKGAKGRTNLKEAGDFLVDNAHFWVPLIGLFSGAREDEIASLALEDLTFDKDADCWIFDIKEGKTSNAPRKVPVHPELVKIGLLDYRNAVKAAGFDVLFPDCHGNYRSPGEEISRWFTRYRKDINLYERWKDFHSLRHNFRTQLYTELKAHPVMVREVMGHAQVDEMDVVYFHGFEPKDTAPVLRALTFAPLDLTHLHRVNQPTRLLQLPRRRRGEAAPPPHESAATDISENKAAPKARTPRKRQLVAGKEKAKQNKG